MSEKKPNEMKGSGWTDWASKRKDWNMSNSKRPKLEIHKNHLSHSSQSSNGKSSGPSTSGSNGRGGSFRRTSSMPMSTVSESESSQKDTGEGFVDPVQEEFDAMEAQVLAEAAAAVENEIAQSQVKKSADKHVPPTVKRLDAPKLDFKNNGSSGFENLFTEELAEEDVEECMLLASQEIQASQNAVAVQDSTFTQAYNVFSKGIDTHSSILETAPTFKKPVQPSLSLANRVPQTKAAPSAKPPQLTKNHRVVPSNLNTQTRNAISANQLRSGNGIGVHSKPVTSNPQAEAEVRRLTNLQEEHLQSIKALKDLMRTKDGEAAILRSQLKQVLVDRDQQKSRSARSAAASEEQYKERLSEQDKKIEALKLQIQFEKAEAQTAKERFKVFANNERVKLVEPQSPGPSGVGLLKTPTRQKAVSEFLNRSTFGESVSPRRPAAKRPRIELREDPTLDPQEGQPDMDVLPVPQSLINVVKPDTKTVGEQTSFDVYQHAVKLRLTPRTLGEKLSDRLIGVQLYSVEFPNTNLWRNDDASFEEKETIPTLSLLKVGPRSRQRCVPLDVENRPCLLNCSASLKHLLSWNDPTTDCPPTRAAICHIAEECTGILHYNLLLLQGNPLPSDKDLRDREHEIVSRGLELVPLRGFDIHDEKQWYKEEYGVEMRRCLGILSEIALASRFAASLMTGALEPNETAIRKHKFTEMPEYAIAKEKFSDEDERCHLLMRVLCDICSIIVSQKLTIAFNGVLAGILTLMKNCAHHESVEEKSQKYILNIIRSVLIARPASAVLLLLVDLLTSVSKCQTIMRGLCSKCDNDDNIVNESYGLCSFTNSSCPLQLMCVQLRAVTQPGRWRLTDSFSEWLLAVINQGSAAPTWILSVPNGSNESHIPCCVRLTSTTIILLFDAFQMLQEIIQSEELPAPQTSGPLVSQGINLKPILSRVLRRSIILLVKLIGNNMVDFMASVEGLYELLVQGIERLQKHLNLSPFLEKYLEDLLQSERDTATAITSDPDPSPIDDSKVNLYLDSLMNLSVSK